MSLRNEKILTVKTAETVQKTAKSIMNNGGKLWVGLTFLTAAGIWTGLTPDTAAPLTNHGDDIYMQNYRENISNYAVIYNDNKQDYTSGELYKNGQNVLRDIYTDDKLSEQQAKELLQAFRQAVKSPRHFGFGGSRELVYDSSTDMSFLDSCRNRHSTNENTDIKTAQKISYCATSKAEDRIARNILSSGFGGLFISLPISFYLLSLMERIDRKAELIATKKTNIRNSNH